MKLAVNHPSLFTIANRPCNAIKCYAVGSGLSMLINCQVVALEVRGYFRGCGTSVVCNGFLVVCVLKPFCSLFKRAI